MCLVKGTIDKSDSSLHEHTERRQQQSTRDGLSLGAYGRRCLSSTTITGTKRTRQHVDVQIRRLVP
jgi:hypothetical protein